MRRGIIYLLIFVLLLIAPSGVRYLRHYELGHPERPAPPFYEPGKIAPVPTPASSEYVDDPEVGEGFILLDKAHRNNFTLDEIAFLDGRLAARGYELRQYFGGDLRAALRSVSAYIVITPLDSFSVDQIQAVNDFVDRGGHLLLVGDPTRFNVAINEEDIIEVDFTLETDEIPLNSLANEFAITFVGDYLYNTSENEGNFRNIILQDQSLGESDLVEGIDRLVFYSSHSLRVGPEGRALLTADAHTWSSATDRPGGLVLAATGGDGRVLALGDIHFLIQPYFTVYDNSRFIANIADFLVEPTERTFVLADFPFFYQRQIDLVYTGSPELGPDAFDEIIALQEAFRSTERELQLAAETRTDHDGLYLGLYNQSEAVGEILASAGISLTIEPPILTDAEIQAQAEEVNGDREGETAEEEPEEMAAPPAKRIVHSDLGDVQMSGTALILRDDSDGRNRVMVLAASNDGLENTVDRLLDLTSFDADYVLADCLLQASLALCPTNVVDEEVEAELQTGGAPEAAEEPPPEEEPGEGDGGEMGPTEEPGVVPQGSVSLGETIVASLAEDETHSWTFNEGPATIDILVGSEDLDIVLELYGPDDELISSADEEYAGGGEQLRGIEIPDSESYDVRIRDFFGGSGTYSLTVALAEDLGESPGGIFVFADDDGEALAGGTTSLETIVALMSGEHAVTSWVSTIDGPLQEGVLDGYDLVVWDSGDYRDEDGFWGDDSAVILAYADDGGDLFIVGASPTVLGSANLALLSDLEVAGDDPILINGFDAGQIIELDGTYETVATEPLTPDSDENTTIFLVRGPTSAGSGDLAGVATFDEANDQRTAILLAPFNALPPDVQEIILGNLLSWFGLSSS